uniref:Uncharacterized protein n=1 Tax=Bos indicus x Bos taurus TaxID=30522 RepID=A0A4W2C2L2_BOBOX
MALIPGVGKFPGVESGNHSSILAWKTSWTEEPVKTRFKLMLLFRCLKKFMKILMLLERIAINILKGLSFHFISRCHSMLFLHQPGQIHILFLLLQLSTCPFLRSTRWALRLIIGMLKFKQTRILQNM